MTTDCSSRRRVWDVKHEQRAKVTCQFIDGHGGRHYFHLHKATCVVAPTYWRSFWPWVRVEVHDG